MIKNLRRPPSSKEKEHLQGKCLSNPLMESSKEGSWTKADVSLGIPFTRFKKRMICRKAKMKQEGPHQGQSNEAKMIKEESR